MSDKIVNLNEVSKKKDQKFIREMHLDLDDFEKELVNLYEKNGKEDWDFPEVGMLSDDELNRFRIINQLLYIQNNKFFPISVRARANSLIVLFNPFRIAMMKFSKEMINRKPLKNDWYIASEHKHFVDKQKAWANAYKHRVVAYLNVDTLSGKTVSDTFEKKGYIVKKNG